MRPLVGIMIGANVAGRLRGPGSDRYLLMIREARKAGTVPYFFQPGDVDVRAGRVKGWTERNGQWREAVWPTPDVIYHRAGWQSREERRAAILCLRGLKRRHGVALLNSRNVLTKWDLYEALAFFPDTADLAPETVLMEGMTDLDAMFRRHYMVYAGKNDGRHGTTVLRVSRDSGGWRLQGNYDGQPTDERFTDPERLFALLLLLRGSTAWVLQRGIEPPLADGRLFAMRAFVQKDGEGEWRVPAVLIRCAEEGGVAVPMDEGGEVFLPDAFIGRFGDQLPQLPDLTELAGSAAVRAAVALESSVGRLGEIGVDMTIDQEGRPWVFGANARPVHPHGGGVQEALSRHPFAYAAYLARRSRTGLDSGLSRLPGSSRADKDRPPAP